MAPKQHTQKQQAGLMERTALVPCESICPCRALKVGLVSSGRQTMPRSAMGIARGKWTLEVKINSETAMRTSQWRCHLFRPAGGPHEMAEWGPQIPLREA